MKKLIVFILINYIKLDFYILLIEYLNINIHHIIQIYLFLIAFIMKYIFINFKLGP